MRRLMVTFMLLLTFSAHAQLDCYFEDDRTSQSMNAISNLMANCSLAPANDYWMCRGLSENSCSLVQGEREHWNCKALTQKNCALTRDSSDYWSCRGITEKSCHLAPADRYWQCRGITENNCGLVPADQYWFCRALGSTFH